MLLGSVLSGPALLSAVNSVTDAEVNGVSCSQVHSTRKVPPGQFQDTDLK